MTCRFSIQAPYKESQMNPMDFEWKAGVVVFWELDELDESQILCEQSDRLKEDLAQIKFPGEIVLDLGWYPSFDPDGEFIVMVVQNRDWENPLYRARAKDFSTLRLELSQAILAST
jgi:hypothetical protein